MKLNIASTFILAGAIARVGATDLAERAVDPISVFEQADVQIDTVSEAVAAFDGSEDARDDLHTAGVSCVTNLTALSKKAAEVDALTEQQGMALRDPAGSLLNSTKDFLGNLDDKLELFEKDEICEGILDAVKMIESSLTDVLGNLTAKTSGHIREGANAIVDQIDQVFGDSIELLENCPPPSTPTPSAHSDTPAATSASSASESAVSAPTSTPETGDASQLHISQIVLVAAVALYAL